MAKKRNIAFLHVAQNAVDIYFDFHEINATEMNLKPLRKKILKKSGSRFFLDTVFASYGISTLKENLAIEPETGSLTFARAQEMVRKELESMK